MYVYIPLISVSVQCIPCGPIGDLLATITASYWSRELGWELARVTAPTTYSKEQHCTALLSTTLHSNALYLTVLNIIVPSSTALYCNVLFCTALHCNVLYCTALRCTVTYCTALHCAAL